MTGLMNFCSLKSNKDYSDQWPPSHSLHADLPPGQIPLQESKLPAQGNPLTFELQLG